MQEHLALGIERTHRARMEIETFLNHVVENYLFKDLAALKPSGVGYPLADDRIWRH